jgi:hypothetical protein
MVPILYEFRTRIITYLDNIVAAKQYSSRNLHVLSYESPFDDIKDNISAEARVT